MIRASRTLLLIATAAAACGRESGVVTASGDIAVAAAYATASAAPEMSALYFTLLNRGAAADTLLRVESVGHAELHTMVTTDGLSKMTPVASLPVHGDSCVAMRPGSYHVMLHGLPTPLAAGDSIDVTITMALAGSIEFRMPVVTYTDVIERLDAARGVCP